MDISYGLKFDKYHKGYFYSGLVLLATGFDHKLNWGPQFYECGERNAVAVVYMIVTLKSMLKGTHH